MLRLRSSESKPTLAAAAIFFTAGLGLAFLLLKVNAGHGVRVYLTGENWLFAAAASDAIFLSATVLVFFRPKIGYAAGIFAGLLATPWFATPVSSIDPSLWAYLNGPDDFPGPERRLAILTIVSVTLVAAATACGLSRLLPSGLILRNIPVRCRTWPAIAIAVLAIAGWFYHSAGPWMLPDIVDGPTYVLRILHVEKRGLHFHESSVRCFHRGMFEASRYDRRLFEYGFEDQSTSGVMPDLLRKQVDDFARSLTLRNLHTARPKALRAWNAEGWYVSAPGVGLLAFTTEYGTNPPLEIRDILEQIEKLPGTKRSTTIQDVCMGFCYDPVAGLGYWYSNQRCHTLENGTTQCR